MPMNASILALTIRDAMLQMPVGAGVPMSAIATPEQQLQMLDAWERVAQAIIDHITTAAIVSETTHAHSGVTTGTGVSGPPVTFIGTIS